MESPPPSRRGTTNLKQFVKSCFGGPGFARRTITAIIIGCALFYVLMYLFMYGVVKSGGTL